VPRLTRVAATRAAHHTTQRRNARPSFLLLDEPFSGIDPKQVLEIQNIIFDLKRHGIGVLVIGHNARETPAVTDRAYIINNGRIFRVGNPEALGQDPKVANVPVSAFPWTNTNGPDAPRAGTDASAPAGKLRSVCPWLLRDAHRGTRLFQRKRRPSQ
jgi:ABC-type cobalamin transport system ATPase subunit